MSVRARRDAERAMAERDNLAVDDDHVGSIKFVSSRNKIYKSLVVLRGRR